MNKLLAFLLPLTLVGCVDSLTTSTCPPGNTCIPNTQTQQVRNNSQNFGLYNHVDSGYASRDTMQKIGFIGKCDVYFVHLYYEHIITICPHQKTTNIENTFRSGKQDISTNDEEVQ